MSTEERTDLADDIAAAYDEHSEDEVVEIETDDVVEDEDAEDVEENVSVEETDEEESTEEESSEEETDAEEEDEKRKDHQEEAVEDDVEPLAHWKRDDKEYFKTLPAKAKNFLIERDKEFQRHPYVL